MWNCLSHTKAWVAYPAPLSTQLPPIYPRTPPGLGWEASCSVAAVAGRRACTAPSCIVIVGSPPSTQVAGWQKVCKLEAEANWRIIGAIHLQGWASLQPVWGHKVIICKERRGEEELLREKKKSEARRFDRITITSVDASCYVYWRYAGVLRTSGYTLYTSKRHRTIRQTGVQKMQNWQQGSLPN